MSEPVEDLPPLATALVTEVKEAFLTLWTEVDLVESEEEVEDQTPSTDQVLVDATLLATKMVPTRTEDLVFFLPRHVEEEDQDCTEEELAVWEEVEEVLRASKSQELLTT